MELSVNWKLNFSMFLQKVSFSTSIVSKGLGPGEAFTDVPPPDT